MDTLEILTSPLASAADQATLDAIRITAEQSPGHLQVLDPGHVLG